MEQKTAETTSTEETAVIAEAAEGGAAEAPETNGTSDAEFADGGTGEKTEEPAQKKQTKEQNAEYARRRRAEERERELKKAREEAILDALGGKNPYTGDEMKDGADVQEFLTMREIERGGGDPLRDFAKFDKDRKRKAQKDEDEARERAEWYRSDREAFETSHPGVNVDEIVKDTNFQKFADGKVGTKPLSEIYDDFMDFVSAYENKAKEKAAQIIANAKATPGALASPDTPEVATYTREQVAKMTPAEVKANYEKIRESMTKWKN